MHYHSESLYKTSEIDAPESPISVHLIRIVGAALLKRSHSRSQRAKGFAILNPSCDAGEPAVVDDFCFAWVGCPVRASWIDWPCVG
jgi:hypothetical protein